ncbi:MAG TPA: hypothetical protein VF779_14305 [Pyrinomonadaceae bacterium]
MKTAINKDIKKPRGGNGSLRSDKKTLSHSPEEADQNQRLFTYLLTYKQK